jgi:hypothetical protein
MPNTCSHDSLLVSELACPAAINIYELILLGIFHGFLHLGFAFEFNQPAIVAEALGMVCVNDAESEIIEWVFLNSEQFAGGARKRGRKTLRQLMEEARKDEILKKSIEGPYVRDRSKNVITNAAAQMMRYTAQYSLSDDQLEERIHEMVDTCGRQLITFP